MKKYKHTLLMTIPFLLIGLNACKDYEYKMVVDGKGSIGANDYFAVLRDMYTDNTKLYYWNHKPNLFDDIELSDTVTLVFHKGIFTNKYAGDFYDKHNIISCRDASMDVDGKTIAMRKPDDPVISQITRGRIRVF